jgi:UDP-N-acetylglucosamine--N-acetylmuramyl-(pentapeptide) pyrophosphoryl-undecaprenol N-acetylglucosamine transferase
VDETLKAYQDAGFDADVRAFFNDFHEQYAAADLIVARSGGAVAEIKATGRASILIPLPTAADDHQTKNAQAMVAENAAVMIPNSELTGERLASTVKRLLSDLPSLVVMEENARRIAVLDAEERIVDLAERAIEKRGARV